MPTAARSRRKSPPPRSRNRKPRQRNPAGFLLSGRTALAAVVSVDRVVGAVRYRADIVGGAAYRVACGNAETCANQRDRQQLLNHDRPSVIDAERSWP